MHIALHFIYEVPSSSISSKHPSKNLTRVVNKVNFQSSPG